MISRHTKGRPWYDVLAFILVVFIVVSVVLAAIHGIAPTSGLTHALDQAGQSFAKVLRGIAGAFDFVAAWFASW
jgi:hypothetical protein